jgi:glycosyltransferase involved in cell wall biosynthesis
VKILAVSDYLQQGGAAIACERLSVALKAAGADVHRFAFLGSPSERSAVPYSAGIGARLEGFLSLAFAGKNPPLRRRLRARSALRRLSTAIEKTQPDVINLHNLHAADLPLAEIAARLGDRPVIWTLHDMWSFTGRCAYAYNCTQFLTGCTASCPTPTEYPALAPPKISGAWAGRAEFLSRRPAIAAACPSSWLATEARRGLWKERRVDAIANALPLDVFFPVPKAAARAALGLPDGKRFALLAADYLAERRKGGDLIQAALAQVAPPGWEILLLGNDSNIPLPGWSRRSLGYVRDDTVKRLIYSAADVLLHPAPVDNLPNTVAEALACGTPVAAFNIGGVPEMVIPGVTGWLSASLDAASYADCLRSAFTALSGGTLLGAGCRQHAAHLFSPASAAKAYLDLASSLISSRHVHA